MFKYVTCAAVRIVHPDSAPSMIDHAIRTALRERKPAYIEIACNLSDAPCSEPGPFEAIMAHEESNSRGLAGAVDRVTALLAGAKKPILLAGAHLRCSYGAIGAFRDAVGDG
jgi:pyruvate decarboxylase